MPEEKFTNVLGSQMHYLEEGTGDAVLFLHGNPASSYLWRNIIPYISPYSRCIAPDLIGHGKSAKPDIQYNFFDHYNYLKAFTEKLKLDNITLVLHDWGSALGFHYALHHRDKIKGIAFMEAFVRPWKWSDLKWEYRLGFKLLRTPLVGEFMIYGMNAFLNLIMPRLTIRNLSREEKKMYKAPFRKINSRKPMLVWPREIPINGKPKDIHNLMDYYGDWLQKSSLPKLLLYGMPGALINQQVRHWCEKNLTVLSLAYVGEGLHYLPEDQPHETGKALANWYSKLSSTS
ncbi:MAG: haloalkane dehalogenase [Bacteroidales bacterium]|nr:haloalkane dehalogenase [Bacteroidales bacterium]